MLLILVLNHFLWANQTALEGRWQQPCQNQVIREENFDQGDVTLSEFYFFDGQCTRPLMTIRNEGVFSLTETTIDFTFGGITLAAEDEAIVADFNARAVCGFTDWAVHEEKVISGLSCALVAGGTPIKVSDAGQKRFGIFKIEGDLLYFGRLEKDHDALSPETRPVSFDPRFYKKLN
jgi:hypothetical protein